LGFGDQVHVGSALELKLGDHQQSMTDVAFTKILLIHGHLLFSDADGRNADA
jgi:hypothetical protein